MSGLSNIYLESILNPLVPLFEGVFSADNIPLRISKKPRFYLICNLSAQNEEGSHWIVIIGEPSRTVYLDSLGFTCFLPKLKLFLKMCKRQSLIISRKIQHLESTFCGFFCIYFILHHNKFRNTNHIFQDFSSDLRQNSNIVINKILDLLNSTN